MKTKIKTWGHSVALRIPKRLAEEVGLEESSKVDLSVHEGKLVVEPVRTRCYELDGLLSIISKENSHAWVHAGATMAHEAG